MLHAALLLPLLAAAAQDDAVDPRTLYDVEAYELELAVRPEERLLEGRVVVRGRAVGQDLARVELDMDAGLELLGAATPDGAALEAEREEDRVRVTLPEPLAIGDDFAVALRYRGSPRAKDTFSGFHWTTSADGSPWINTSCQGLGAHTWWPCKASYWHPEDKPARVSMDLTVPEGLTGVSNGRLVETRDGGPDWFDAGDGAWTTFAWAHPYPLETYTVTLNVGPYVRVEHELDTAGRDESVPFVYYVLPESVEKARVQFRDVPRLVAVFEEAFGPWPFPESKIGLVETNFWGMEHSTAVAYGSSYPAWCEQEGEPDPYGSRNELFDYILVHEMAHEWWGNAVSAADWGHFWIHEGLGTYAEGVYVEFTQGRETADEFFAGLNRSASRARGALFRGEDVSSGEAYAGLLYSKGACVLNTLRHCVEDDEAWWTILREFQRRHLHGNATTGDFFAVVNETTRKNWGWFEQQFVRGEGSPRLSVDVEVLPEMVKLRVDNETGDFTCPVDLAWTEDGAERRERVWVQGGASRGVDFTTVGAPTDVRVLHLDRIVGRHEAHVHGHDVGEGDGE